MKILNFWNHHLLLIFGEGSTPPKFNSSPLKNGGWNTILCYWDGNFSGAMLIFQQVTKNVHGFFFARGGFSNTTRFAKKNVSMSKWVNHFLPRSQAQMNHVTNEQLMGRLSKD